MQDFLKRIEAYKLSEIEAAKIDRPIADLVAAARDIPAPRGFIRALDRRKYSNQFALIAEIKKGSPSQGIIRGDFDPEALAGAYERGGAACLSVLTDRPSFHGSAQDLIAARSQVALPVLRKDFMFETYQVYEARCWGADCILVILAAVTDIVARQLLDAAKELGMDALIEVHDRAELDRALALEPIFIGINNRDLRTFKIDLSVSVELARHVPEETHLVCESGITSYADITEMSERAGITSFLVGESLMRQSDIERATTTLLTGQSTEALKDPKMPIGFR